jgi:diguanylate cyclase (GGDEF)-like protein
VHKDRPNVGLYVSRPFQSKLRDGEPTLAISRRLSHPDGRFAGVIGSGVALAKTSALFKDLNLGKHGSITLFRDDGIVLMHQPYIEGQVGQDLGSTPNFQRFRREGSGSFTGKAAFDQIQRLYVFGRVDGFPLILTISKSVDDLLEAWQQKAVAQSGITLLICGALVGLMLLLQRELRGRAAAEAKLARLASTDDLTGLPNRRTFREAYERERRSATRSGSWLSVLYVDADFFKRYNDQYGHGRGDDLLRAIAQTLEAHIRRPRDIAARYGGEEFTILLPDTDPSGAKLIAETIREAVMLMGVEHRHSPYGVATVSIGVASRQPSLGTVSTVLLDAADAAIYKAKAAGRKCVYVQQVTPAPSLVQTG